MRVSTSYIFVLTFTYYLVAYIYTIQYELLPLPTETYIYNRLWAPVSLDPDLDWREHTINTPQHHLPSPTTHTHTYRTTPIQDVFDFTFPDNPLRRTKVQWRQLTFMDYQYDSITVTYPNTNQNRYHSSHSYLLHHLPPTVRWLPVISSLYTLTSSADIVSIILAHSMILNRGNEIEPTSSSNTALTGWVQ